MLLERAIELRNNEVEPEEIVSQLEVMKKHISTILTLPTLKYLRANGRVSMPKFLLGALLGLKPITKMNYETGENEAVGTVRNATPTGISSPTS